MREKWEMIGKCAHVRGGVEHESDNVAWRWRCLFEHYDDQFK